MPHTKIKSGIRIIALPSLHPQVPFNFSSSSSDVFNFTVEGSSVESIHTISLSCLSFHPLGVLSVSSHLTFSRTSGQLLSRWRSLSSCDTLLWPGSGVHLPLDIMTWLYALFLYIIQILFFCCTLDIMLTAVGSVCVVCHIALFLLVLLHWEAFWETQIFHYFSNLSLFLFSLSHHRR